MSEGQASSQETLSGFFSRGTSQIALILPLDPQLDFSGLHSAGILISTASFRETYPCCPQESSQVGARWCLSLISPVYSTVEIAVYNGGMASNLLTSER